MTKTTHQWLIAFSRSALQELRELPSTDRMAVFRVLRRLLQADNPVAAHGVKKLKGVKDQYRARRRLSDSLQLTGRPDDSFET